MKKAAREIITEKMHNALDNYGATLPNWKVSVTDISKAGFDTVWVTAEVTEPRKRKASVRWTLLVDTVRDTVDFTQSQFIDFRHGISGYGR